jgi:hypothetical protein
MVSIVTVDKGYAYCETVRHCTECDLAIDVFENAMFFKYTLSAQANTRLCFAGFGLSAIEATDLAGP